LNCTLFIKKGVVKLKTYKGEIGLLIVAIIWGSGFVASDIAIGFFTPYQVLAIRFVIAAIILSIVFRKKLSSIKVISVKYGILLGLILYFSFLFQTVGLVYTTPSKNAFITSVNVIIVPFIGLLIYRKKIDIHGIISSFISIVGIGVISFNSNMTINIGDVLTLLSAIGYAFHIFYTGEFLKRGSDPISLTIIQMIVAAFTSLVALLFTTGSENIAESFKIALIATIYLGVFSTSLCFLLQTISQKNVSETKTAIILSTESVFGSIFSIIILSEKITLRTVLGCLLIFIAIIISEIKPNFNMLGTNKKYR
jgi:drug/metabolite transporter (DMT)-like permease